MRSMFPMAGAARMVGQGFEGIFAVGLSRPRQQRNFDALVQCLAFAQAEPYLPKIRDGIKECQTSEDLREGLAALKEKRTPAFKGR